MLSADRNELRIACGGGTVLNVREAQLEGRKRLSTREFLNGVKILPDEKVE
jgi:methionyl-tRNA formyltransferase